MEALVRMKLDSNRDRAHIRDLIAVGLLDETWVGKYPPLLAERLRYFFDHPE
ncbi:hypothetical protein BH11PLA2_BH11PLA2_10910 [soil metagenome]